MKYKWLNKSGNKKVIVFFNGWGMDESVIKHLGAENYDVLMFYDYNSIETDFNFASLEFYEEKNLLSWSMGVMVATLFPDIYTNKIAINGTLKPVDINYGINPKIYDLTINGFSEKSCHKFIQNMFEDFIKISVERDFDGQKNELIAIKRYSANDSFRYDKILISKNDKIIPTKNQVAFWGIEPNQDGGHCPFFNYKTWEDML